MQKPSSNTTTKKDFIPLVINPNLLEAEYAVRGKLAIRAAELENEGREIIYTNIGNPQSLGQNPLSYIRDYLMLATSKEKLDIIKNDKNLAQQLNLPNDIIQKVENFFQENPYGIGAYTSSKGYLFVRKAVVNFIKQRDGIAIDPEKIYLTDGASKGVQAIIYALLGHKNDGVMISIPQYPLYSATVKLYGGNIIGYELSEEDGWQLKLEDLEKSYTNALKNGINPRLLAVINPGNPTGGVLTRESIVNIIKFAAKYKLPILADEVYQENLYDENADFHSFAKVMKELEVETGETLNVALASVHSASKGLIGECGIRGGFLLLSNFDSEFEAQLLKLMSIGLCANTNGQLLTYLMVDPPKKGDASYEKYLHEKTLIFRELHEKSNMLFREINKINGMHLNKPQGAMYGFVRFELPVPKNVDLDIMSESERIKFDTKRELDYCLALLEATGISVVPGSGFGQKFGTMHFRTTFLPPKDKIAYLVEKIKEFHLDYVERIKKSEL